MISPVLPSGLHTNKISQKTAPTPHFRAKNSYPAAHPLKNDVFAPSFGKIGGDLSENRIKHNAFSKEAMTPENPKWEIAIKRFSPVEKKPFETRSDFARDKNRIMHSEGFDRMRFKTQVFPLCENDMVSTRSSHVLQVTDIARNICKNLGLNEELAETIALGHDIGHAPFGHDGENSLRKITKKEGLEPFWHEKNSLRMVDKILTLTNTKGEQNNLGLTYAVRDGIVNHCGEVDENYLKPRQKALILEELTAPGQVQPYTWEGVVVKIADKIAYLGKDIEDAYKIGLFSDKNKAELKNIVQKFVPNYRGEVNNTSLINLFTADLINNSDPKKGIGFSENAANLMNAVKKYNYEHIYKAKGAKNLTQEQCDTIIFGIYDRYMNLYKGENTIDSIKNDPNPCTQNFRNWLIKYSDNKYRDSQYKNSILYDLKKPEDYKQAVIDYISGMTDKYALKTYDSAKIG